MLWADFYETWASIIFSVTVLDITVSALLTSIYLAAWPWPACPSLHWVGLLSVWSSGNKPAGMILTNKVFPKY